MRLGASGSAADVRGLDIDAMFLHIAGVAEHATWFTYEYCTDLAATREFYGRHMGLVQIWDEPDTIAFRHEGVQISFQLVGSLTRPPEWAFQPGWSYGQLPDAPPTVQVRSISIALAPQDFRAAVARMHAAGVAALRPEPFWVGYWSYVVRDPDGLTVELTDPTSAAPPQV